MKREAAVEFVRGMLKNVRNGSTLDAEQRGWRERIGLYAVLDTQTAGVVHDYKEPDWTVNENALPELMLYAEVDGAAYDMATWLICAYLRWERRMPKTLSDYTTRRILGQSKKPHRKLRKNTFRDDMARVAIGYLQDNGGIQPDRNDTSTAECGIEIVTQALKDAGYTATVSAIRTAYYKAE